MTVYREGGEISKRRDYLSVEKQFLITRNVPCLRRVKQMEYTDEDSETQVETEDGEEAWVATHSGRATTNIEEIAQQIEGDEDEISKRLSKVTVDDIIDKDDDDIPNIEDIPDIDEVEEGLEEDEDPSALPTNNNEDAPSDKILQVRTYDVFITYDKYYQTPRMWLYGYDEHRRPLTSVQIFEDISQDYAKKTVTIETHPHLNMSLASIHPCRHAQVMKKIIEKMNEESVKKFETFQQMQLEKQQQQQSGGGVSTPSPQAEQAQVRVDQ
ncbi:9190_t:CDS:2 [Ambispora gerdemannii]|uniref:Autophagy-related protein 3 n=1 Tax=Ambispora gerdemannii TaxID=144530 RepID=A0A9N8WCK7_9GLOM|nr:9190_t:CDS:2 [Ambispora gerdemannii]